MILLAAVAVVALAGLAYSVFSWQQNQGLKSDLVSQKTQISELKEEVTSLRATLEEAEDAADAADDSSADIEVSTTTAAVDGEVGEVINTTNGTIKVNSFRETSLEETTTSSDSTEPLLELDITLTNTTDSTQTYSYDQFTFINSTKTVQPNGSGYFIVCQSCFPDVLATSTMAAGGSIQKKVYFDKYDSKQGVLRWVNPSGQEIKITIPGV